MKIRYCYSLIIIVVLTLTPACQKNTPGNILTGTSSVDASLIPVLSQSSIIPTDTITPTHIKQATLTPKATKTKQPSISTPTPDPTIVVNDARIGIEGNIWVYFPNRFNYLVIDPNQGTTKTVDAPPEDCQHVPIPQSLRVICRSESGFYLYDLLTKERQELPIPAGVGVWTQTNLPDNLFYYSDSGSGTKTLYTYSLTTNVTEILYQQADTRFMGIPKLSTDKRLLVAHLERWVDNKFIDDRVVEIDRETGDIHTISPDITRATDNIEWSPKVSKLIYGTSDLKFEIGEMANYIYLWDVKSNQHKLIATPPPSYETYDEYGWPVWSPNGEQVVVISRNAICILTIKDGNQRCTFLNEPDDPFNYMIDNLSWSPDGRQIAFLEFPNAQGGNPGNLTIYSLDKYEFQEVINNEIMSDLFWR